MAHMNESVTVAFEIEPIVKLKCFALFCRHNMGRMTGDATCNLKRLVISSSGKCEQYEEAQPGGETS